MSYEPESYTVLERRSRSVKYARGFTPRCCASAFTAVQRTISVHVLDDAPTGR